MPASAKIRPRPPGGPVRPRDRLHRVIRAGGRPVLPGAEMRGSFTAALSG
jgi:hypothetical protein